MTQCKLYEIQILMPINKALLEYIHASSLTYCLWLLLGYDGRVEQLKHYVACRA